MPGYVTGPVALTTVLVSPRGMPWALGACHETNNHNPPPPSNDSGNMRVTNILPLLFIYLLYTITWSAPIIAGHMRLVYVPLGLRPT